MKQPAHNGSARQTSFGGLLTKRSVVVPTWRGWSLLLVFIGALGSWAFFQAHHFLATNDPVPGGILVVEGYAWDSMLREAIAEFGRHPYEKVFITGGPIDRGEPLAEYKTLPDLAVATMEKMGMDRKFLQAVSSPPVVKDRTYASAVALREWLHDHHVKVSAMNLMAAGFHARRSRLLFQKAFGPSVRVGVIAYEDDPQGAVKWWTSSAGVRGLVDEGVGYIYARLLFWQSP
jgi:hypothetical protein